LTVNEVLSDEVRGLLVAVKESLPVLLPVIVTLLKVAIPPEAETVPLLTFSVPLRCWDNEIDALLLTRFPYWSSINTVIAGLIVLSIVTLLGGSTPQASLFAVVALTATFRFPDPEELIEPSVTLTFAVSASYSIIVRLEVETPLVNVIGVVVPKLVALTVGWVTGLVEGSAPEKVRLWLPV
jgi:hypothetical protein